MGPRYYAYRVDGPSDPAAGQRFDPDKVLLDPYARAVFFPPAFDREAAMGRGANAGRAPLGVLEAESRRRTAREACRPRHAWDTVIYEMHVRGFTRRANSRRGRRNAAAPSPASSTRSPTCSELGVTAVELLPVFQRDPQEGNYWGYMPLNFFAPHYAVRRGRHARGAPSTRCAAMVRALHDAGIEVILDVVYNHTVEGDERGPTY